LKPKGGDAISADTVEGSDTGLSWTLTFGASHLTYGTTYQFVLLPGNIFDAKSNEFAMPFSYNYTTIKQNCSGHGHIGGSGRCLCDAVSISSYSSYIKLGLSFLFHFRVTLVLNVIFVRQAIAILAQPLTQFAFLFRYETIFFYTSLKSSYWTDIAIVCSPTLVNQQVVDANQESPLAVQLVSVTIPLASQSVHVPLLTLAANARSAWTVSKTILIALESVPYNALLDEEFVTQPATRAIATRDSQALIAKTALRDGRALIVLNQPQPETS